MTPADPCRGRQPRNTVPAAASNSTTQVRLLTGRDWALLREIRLRALAEAPEAFGATLCEAQARTAQQWRDRITQRAQFVAVTNRAAMGTVAGAADPDRDSVHLCSFPDYRPASVPFRMAAAAWGSSYLSAPTPTPRAPGALGSRFTALSFCGRWRLF